MTFDTAWEEFKATVVELTIDTAKRAEINGLKFDEQKLRSAILNVLNPSEEVRRFFVAGQHLRAQFLVASDVCENLAFNIEYKAVGREIIASEDAPGVDRLGQISEFLNSAAGILRILLTSPKRTEEVHAHLLGKAAEYSIK